MMRRSLKALSVKLPWAWLMFPDLVHWTSENRTPKDIENRDYATTWRGTIGIHCSKRIEREDIYQAEMLIKERNLQIKIPTLAEFQKYAGKIIGTVDIVDCIDTATLSKLSAVSVWLVGRYGWVLKAPISLPEPIPHRGSISPILWDVQPEGLLQINKQIGDKL